MRRILDDHWPFSCGVVLELDSYAPTFWRASVQNSSQMVVCCAGRLSSHARSCDKSKDGARRKLPLIMPRRVYCLKYSDRTGLALNAAMQKQEFSTIELHWTIRATNLGISETNFLSTNYFYGLLRHESRKRLSWNKRSVSSYYAISKFVYFLESRRSSRVELEHEQESAARTCERTSWCVR